MASDEDTPQVSGSKELADDLFGDDSEGDTEAMTHAPASAQADVQSGGSEAASAGGNATAKESIKDLFGDSDDEAQEEAEAQQPKQKPVMSESDEEEEGYLHHMAQPTHSKLCVPAYPSPNPSAALCMLKVPHFMGVSMEEYHPNTYNAEEDRMKFPKAATVMRWRYRRDSNGELVLGADGRPIRESNARLVRWSDGTTQLMVGDDVYNVALSQIHNRNSYLYATLRSDAPRTAEDAGLDPQLDLGRSKENGEHEWHNKTDVEMRSILECHGQIMHDAKIVPTGLQSEQHKRLAMEVRKHSLKAKKVRELGRVTMDPEKQSALTAEARKLTIKRQRREQTLARRNRPAMNIDYLEEGMDDDTSLARIKSRTRDRFHTPLEDTGEDLKDFIVDEDDEEDEDEEGDYEEDGDSDEEDEDEEEDQGDEEEEDEFDDEEDDDEEGDKPSRKSKEKKRKPQAESSAASSSAADSAQQKRRKRIVDDDEDEED